MKTATPTTGRIGWLYLLVLTPTLTELAETGRLPSTPREWITEVVGGAVIALLVDLVRREHRMVQLMARTDRLTGLLNRGSFEQALERECARARRYARPLGLICFDLDRFKQLNDSAGHGAGDRALGQFAAALGTVARAKVDLAFRIGGDEFALLLPDTTALHAGEVAARLQARLGGCAGPFAEGTLGASAGIVDYAPPESTADFLRRADEAMYRSKRARRSAAPAR
ncbi:MAG: GGDEF domain-containing protein [Rubrivivax sp.]